MDFHFNQLMCFHLCCVAPQAWHPVECVYELPKQPSGAMGERDALVLIQQGAAFLRDAGPHHRHCPLRLPDGETAIRAALCALHRWHWSREGTDS